jgi:uncharacterized protein YbjQ (UPF0145 family)
MGHIELSPRAAEYPHRVLGRVGVRAPRRGWMSETDLEQEMASLVERRAAALGADAVVEVRFRKRRRLRSVTYSMSGVAVAWEVPGTGSPTG